MICYMGGFPTIRHNEIRDITPSLLTEVCHNVATEPLMQPLTGETLALRSANSEDGARLDIRARGFWNRSHDAFFDVRVFYPNAPSNRLFLEVTEIYMTSLLHHYWSTLLVAEVHLVALVAVVAVVILVAVVAVVALVAEVA